MSCEVANDINGRKDDQEETKNAERKPEDSVWQQAGSAGFPEVNWRDPWPGTTQEEITEPSSQQPLVDGVKESSTTAPGEDTTEADGEKPANEADLPRTAEPESSWNVQPEIQSEVQSKEHDSVAAPVDYGNAQEGYGFPPQGEPSPYSSTPPYAESGDSPPYSPFPQQNPAQPQPPVQQWQEQGQYTPYPNFPDQGGQYSGPSGYQPQPFYNFTPPPRKQTPLGLKVFLWVLSILSVGTIAGFVIYLGYSAANPQLPQTQESPSWYDQIPEAESSEENEDEAPDYESGVEIPDPEQETPDIDLSATEGIVISPHPDIEQYTASEIYEKVAPSTVTVSCSIRYSSGEEATTTGTGIIATSDGYIITNSHVVFNSKSTSVLITTSDGEVYNAVVVGADRTTDLAVLKTNDHSFTPAEFGNIDNMVIGDEVIAIGNPGGEQFSSSLTKGVISGLDRMVGDYSDNGMTYIQTDAAINPGNSGGPLVNMYGQVIGINSSKIVSTGYEGMGFAIPVSKAQGIINELCEGGYVKGRTRLGITGKDISTSESQYYGVPQGFMIQEIDEDSAFQGTEAEPYDIIIAIDGEEVTGIDSISNLLLRYAPGDQVEVTLYRAPETEMDEGKELKVTIMLLEDTGETQG